MMFRIGDRSLFPIGLGTYGMGGRDKPDLSDDGRYSGAIRYALDSGINLIDTAEMYADGHTEEVVGEAIRGYDRDRVYVVSKVWPNHLEHEDLLKAADRSLERLGLDYIDLYLIHWPSSSVKLEESLKAMAELKAAGKIASIGVSNFDSKLLREAINILGEGEIAANEIEYSYLVREPENELIPFCKKNDVAVISYTPLARGRVRKDRKLQRVASRTGASELQLALRYLMDNSIPIPKASSRKHIDEIIGAASLNIPEGDLRYLSE